MKLFFKILLLQIKISIQYRTTFLLSLIGEPISFLITAAFFSRIYAFNEADTMLGYSLSQMIWYFAGLTLIWYCVWNDVDNRISNKILSGDLAIDLLRPVSVFTFELGYAVGTRILGMLLEFIPSGFIFSIIFFPDFLTLSSILKFMVAITLSFVIFFLINYMIGLTAFFIKSNYSLQSIKFVIISLMAGAYIPLEFFPKWFNKIAAFIPFEYIFYWPVQILLNRELIRGTPHFLKVIVSQLAWIGILFILACILWKQAIKKFCAIGG